MSPYHKEALDHLLYGIDERKGFIVITGGIGTGKTTLCRTLLSHLDASTRSALLFNAFISDEELLQTINREFGIETDPAASSKKDYIDALNNFLLKIFGSGGNAVLLIDEAQNLSHTVLEQIRMLSNLETEKEKLIQIVLVGQSELKELLATPSLKQLDERITVRYDLRPLERKDIQGYVEHRLVVAGNRGDLRFTRGAFKKIYAYSQGNPRRINAVCDRALLIGYAKEERTISKGMVEKAVKDFRRNMTIDPLVMGWSKKRVEPVGILLVLLVILAGFAVWNSREDIADLFSSEQKIAVARSGYSSVIQPKPQMEAATLFLDEKASLAGLFDLFQREVGEYSYDRSKGKLRLVSFHLQPEYHVLLKKPFRVRLSNLVPSSFRIPSYLLIRQVRDDDVVAVDANDEQRDVTRDFVLRHWGYDVSWFYPYGNKSINLTKGMRSDDVLELQRILNGLGYLVETTGVYGESTFQEVARFQTAFGLIANGIAGLKTRALLYQMSD